MIRVLCNLLTLCSLVGGKILALNFKNEDNSEVETFISTYLPLEPITFIYGNTTAYNPLLKVNFSKVLYNYQLEENISYSGNNNSYILLLDSPQSVSEALGKCTKLDNWNNRQPFLFILQDYLEKRYTKQIFDDCWRVKVFNVVIYNKNNTFYTWYPYKKRSNCGKEIRLVQVRNQNPYLGKIPTRVHSCSINVTWYKDFFNIDPFKKDNPGAQVLFLNTLAGAMNLNVTYLKNNTDYMSSIFHMHNDNILLDDMEHRNIDMALLVALLQSESQRSEDSAIFFEDGMYLLLPTRKYIIKDNYIVNTFTPVTIITTLCSFVLVCIVWKAFSDHPIMDTAFILVQLSLQMSITKKLLSKPVKILFLSFLIFMICLNTAYQSNTSSLLTTPSLTPKIETIDQFVFETDIKIKAVAMSDCFIYYNGMYRDFKQTGRTLFGNPNISTYHNLKDFVEEDSFAITIPGSTRNYFKNPEKLEIVKKNEVNLIFLLRLQRGFPLLENINYWIEEMREKGFSEKYGSQYMIPSKQLYAKEQPFLTHTPLRLIHVQGAFHILISGYLIATVVFLIEVFLKK